MKHDWLKKHLILLFVSALSMAVSAQNYIKRHAMIPMRDGVKLYTEIYEPTDNGGAHPVLMMRTPYYIGPYNKDVFDPKAFSLDSIYLKHGYILVRQNVRGTYLSEGQFRQVRPYIANKRGRATDEASDAYDTVEWLLSHCHTNGRVGVKGTSYPGFYALMATLSRHPAIKATSPQAPVGDWFMGDDIHHNGALMLMDSYGFGTSFFRQRQKPSAEAMPQLAPVDTTVDVFYRRPLSDILAPALEKGSFWQDIVSHPNYDGYWQIRRSTRGIGHVKPAVMVVGGLYDAEDNYGTWSIYRRIREQSPEAPLYLVEAPWYHHAWANDHYQHLDGAWFGTGSARYFIRQIEYPFFAYYLEGKGHQPAPVTLMPSMETSEARMKGTSSDRLWTTLDTWPPRGMHYEKFQLKGGTVISDPLHPAPYYHDTATKKRDKAYMAADQRFATRRKDVLSFEGEALKDTLRLYGPVKVRLTLNTDATDLDAFVKIIDVRPDGYQQLVRWEVMPARFRRYFEKPVRIVPHRDFTLSFTLPDIAHVLLPGHRLMVQVQYSCYPLVAVNPQKFLPNPYKAKASDYRKATVTLKGGGKSYVELPIIRS